MTLSDSDDCVLILERNILLQQMIATLTQRQRTVLEYRFGLGPNEEELTIRQIGDRLLLKEHRVRHIERKALSRAREWFRRSGIAGDEVW